MNRWFLFFSLVCGIASNLYVQTPFGYIGMFEMGCYALGPMLFLWQMRTYTKREHWFLGLIMLWVCGCFVVNWTNEYPGLVTLKAVGITFSMWCMSVVLFWLLKTQPKSLLYFIMGASIGGVISLYAFQNGALMSFALQAGYDEQGYMGDFLQEKQTLPSWLSMFCVSGGIALSLVMRWMSYLIVPAGFFIAGFVSLYQGGSRSGFGVFMIVGCLALGVAFARRVMREAFSNIFIFLGILSLLGLATFSTYKYLAATGQLGEGEQSKYEKEFLEENKGLTGSIAARGGYWFTLENFKENPFGVGGVGAARHSAISESIYKEGIFVIPFWAYFLWIVFAFVRKHLLEFEQWAPFVGITVGTVIWSAFASPFGGRAAYCLVGCLAVLCRNPEFIRQWKHILEMDKRHGKANIVLNHYR